MSARFLPTGIGILSTTRPTKYIAIERSLNLARRLASGECEAGELTNFDFSFSEFSANVAVELGVAIGSLSTQIGCHYAIFEYQRFADVSDSGGGVVRWGSSTRACMRLKALDAKASFGNIYGVSASAQLKLASVDVSVSGVGIKPGKLFDSIPKVVSLDGTSSVELIHAFTKEIPKLMTEGEQLAPTLLGVWGEIVDDSQHAALRDAVASSYALTILRQGKALKEGGEWSNASEPFKESMRVVYQAIADITAEDQRPNSLSREVAKQILGGFETETAD